MELNLINLTLCKDKFLIKFNNLEFTFKFYDIKFLYNFLKKMFTNYVKYDIMFTNYVKYDIML